VRLWQRVGSREATRRGLGWTSGDGVQARGFIDWPVGGRLVVEVLVERTAHGFGGDRFPRRARARSVSGFTRS